MDQNQQQEMTAQYKLLADCSVKQNESSQAQIFNEDSTILAVGCYHSIKIFSFNNGSLKEECILEGHIGEVKALYFGQNNLLYSCGGYGDNTIKIWGKEAGSFKWSIIEELTDHQDGVNCICLTSAENLMFTGSGDQTVKCWIKSDKWKCYQTLSFHREYVNAINLSESEEFLLSCGEDKRLLIFKISDNQVQLIQDICQEDYGFRSSFIGNNIIAYQLQNRATLLIFERQNNQEFIQTKEIQLKGYSGCFYFFPIVYCQSKQILIDKHSNFVNIIRILKDGSFEITQSIEFETIQLYGTITKDGDYLLTWDSVQKELQVRHLS